MTPKEAVAHTPNRSRANPQKRQPIHPPGQGLRAAGRLGRGDQGLRRADQVEPTVVRVLEQPGQLLLAQAGVRQGPRRLRRGARAVADVVHPGRATGATCSCNLREWDKAIESLRPGDQGEPDLRLAPTPAGRRHGGRSGSTTRPWPTPSGGRTGPTVAAHVRPPADTSGWHSRNSTRPWPTSTRPFVSTRSSPPAYFGRAGVYLARKATSRPSATWTRPCGCRPKYAAAMARGPRCGWPAATLDGHWPTWTRRSPPTRSSAPAYRQKAWLLATHPDDVGPRRQARRSRRRRKAVEHTRDAGGETFETLAAALAEDGRFRRGRRVADEGAGRRRVRQGEGRRGPQAAGAVRGEEAVPGVGV